MSKQTIEDILEMFQNGEDRYNKDAYFKEAINALHVGVGAHAILDRVLKEHAILMHLHNEALNKNRVAVAEVARLADEMAQYIQYGLHPVGVGLELKLENQKLKDDVLSLKEANDYLRVRMATYTKEA